MSKVRGASQSPIPEAYAFAPRSRCAATHSQPASQYAELRRPPPDVWSIPSLRVAPVAQLASRA